jgi:hypothetical protein
MVAGGETLNIGADYSGAQSSAAAMLEVTPLFSHRGSGVLHFASA